MKSLELRLPLDAIKDVSHERQAVSLRRSPDTIEELFRHGVRVERALQILTNFQCRCHPMTLSEQWGIELVVKWRGTRRTKARYRVLQLICYSSRGDFFPPHGQVPPAHRYKSTNT